MVSLSLLYNSLKEREGNVKGNIKGYNKDNFTLLILKIPTLYNKNTLIILIIIK